MATDENYVTCPCCDGDRGFYDRVYIATMDEHRNEWNECYECRGTGEITQDRSDQLRKEKQEEERKRAIEMAKRSRLRRSWDAFSDSDVGMGIIAFLVLVVGVCLLLLCVWGLVSFLDWWPPHFN